MVTVTCDDHSQAMVRGRGGRWKCPKRGCDVSIDDAEVRQRTRRDRPYASGGIVPSAGPGDDQVPAFLSGGSRCAPIPAGTVRDILRLGSLTRTLERKGLDARTVAQLRGAGPSGGGLAIAEELMAAGPEVIRAVARQQRETARDEAAR
jgi:hypothetical protein